MSPAGSQRERWIFRGMIDRDRELHPVPVLRRDGGTPHPFTLPHLPTLTPAEYMTNGLFDLEKWRKRLEEVEFESSRLFAENHRLRHYGA